MIKFETFYEENTITVISPDGTFASLNLIDGSVELSDNNIEYHTFCRLAKELKRAYNKKPLDGF